MEDKQMDYVIQKMRESEEKTEELTTVLESFHQSFDKLIGNVERVLEAGAIDQATKSVRQLDTHLGRIEKQMTTHQTHEKQTLDQVAQMLGGMQTVIGTSEIKGRGIESSVSQSSKSIYCDKAIYMIDEDGLTIKKHSLNDESTAVVVNHDTLITSLAAYKEQVYFYDSSEKLRLLQEPEAFMIEDVVEYKMTAYGIVYKNKVGNIKLYKYDGIQKSLAKRVSYYEIVGGHYLLFKSSKLELQYLDLQSLDVDHPKVIHEINS
ncbi:MAG: hypothetical protein ACRCTE_07665 [Cellulosilyticaceae bacterium]